tara:strand:+ start:650 stop:937 length:288 start_codon:yes stop_codon:yes gene_type:complete
MKLNPRNRYVLLTDAPGTYDEEDIPTILLPEEYTTKNNPYGVYTIKQFSADCVKMSLDDIDKLVVVDDSMVETASLDQGEFLLVLENHIYGVLSE